MKMQIMKFLKRNGKEIAIRVGALTVATLLSTLALRKEEPIFDDEDSFGFIRTDELEDVIETPEGEVTEEVIAD